MFRTGVVIRGRAYVKLAGTFYPLTMIALKQKEAKRVVS
jgi:hypothetical protein